MMSKNKALPKLAVRFITSRDAFIRSMKTMSLSYPWSVNPKCLECHCCKHSDVWMHINCSSPHTLLHTNLLLSQACCKLPKYLPCSCQHLSVQQLERLWCISSMSFRPSPEHPFPEGQKRKKGKKKTHPKQCNKQCYSPVCGFCCLGNERLKKYLTNGLQEWKGSFNAVFKRPV